MATTATPTVRTPYQRPPAPPPPPPTQAPYVAPTVAATRFISCHSSSPSGEGPVFLANVELVGGQSWRPAQQNLTHLSGDWWRVTYQIVGASNANPGHFSWSSTTLFGPDAKVHVLMFPSRWVVNATCPS